MRQNMVFSTKKYEKFSGEGHSHLSRSGEGDTPHHASPPRRLRHLDPSHSNILGTLLLKGSADQVCFKPRVKE